MFIFILQLFLVSVFSYLLDIFINQFGFRKFIDIFKNKTEYQKWSFEYFYYIIWY